MISVTFGSRGIYLLSEQSPCDGVREDMTPIEAAQHICETSRDSVAQANLAIAEIRQTIQRLHETRRRTEEIRAKVRRPPE